MPRPKGLFLIPRPLGFILSLKAMDGSIQFGEPDGGQPYGDSLHDNSLVSRESNYSIRITFVTNWAFELSLIDNTGRRRRHTVLEALYTTITHHVIITYRITALQNFIWWAIVEANNLIYSLNS